jgi:DNA invertase Pin-like site-specific DNA recombinase
MEGLPMTIYGYARVSTDGQTLDAQHAKLTEAGAEKDILREGEWSEDGIGRGWLRLWRLWSPETSC